MDSTPHEQTGKKIEGAEFNYKKLWCLDSLNAYDEFGFSYLFQLRPGNTYSSQGAELNIKRIFDLVPKNIKRYFRADSAFSHLGVYNALLNANVSFVMALKANVYNALLEKYWSNIKWKKEKIKFYGHKNCEIGNCLYPISDLAGRSYLRVIFIRTPKEIYDLNINPIEAYDFYALVTNIGQHEMNDLNIIDFYRKRSNAENYIRDQKYGLDFLHFPCLKLSANYVYGLIGTIAYNFMRAASFLFYKKTGCFIKKLRRKLVIIPCQVVHHAQSLTLKIHKFGKEVLQKKINIIHKFETIFQQIPIGRDVIFQN